MHKSADDNTTNIQFLNLKLKMYIYFFADEVRFMRMRISSSLGKSKPWW